MQLAPGWISNRRMKANSILFVLDLANQFFQYVFQSHDAQSLSALRNDSLVIMLVAQNDQHLVGPAAGFKLQNAACDSRNWLVALSVNHTLQDVTRSNQAIDSVQRVSVDRVA